jgi:hypothetical protein
MAKKPKVISERFSMDGWSLKNWVIHNTKTIKEISKWAVGAAAGWFLTQNPAYTAPVALVSKLILDSVEYWIKQYTA